jgi:molybdate/tungstate transport system substrate-binding protein
MIPLRSSASSAVYALLFAACTTNSPSPRDTLVVYVAASLTRPLQPVLDSFAARTHTVALRESGASLEHARKLTELHRIPDVLLLADYEVFPQLLMPSFVTWYAEFARNRMVVAYTPRSKYANEINAGNWTTIVRRPDVQVGRTDPKLAPAGYRTLRLFQLAESHYGERGLAAGLLAHAPERNMRANAADLAALLEAGELDYIYDYQSVAVSNGFRFVQLPSPIDLGDSILYALSIPVAAPHSRSAVAFVKAFFADDATAALRAGGVDVLPEPVVVGTGAPVLMHRNASRGR